MSKHSNWAQTVYEDPRDTIKISCRNALLSLASSELYDVVTNIFDEEFADKICRASLLPLEEAILENLVETIHNKHVQRSI
jgi:hypothetical protein